MKIERAELLAMAARANQYPPEGPPEIAFAGRSNVGKSSLLNLVCARKKLAFVSQNPGKTQTINFYSINGDAFRIVDLPGYGYARVPKSVTAKWGQMVETYLEGRQALRRVVLLVDVRHPPTAQDKQLYEYLQYHDLAGLIVATKADKVNRSQLASLTRQIREALGADAEAQLVCVSALKKTGLEELHSALGAILRA